MDEHKQLVVASSNPKKRHELQQLLRDLPYVAVGLDEFPDCPEVIEDGDTFEANSAKKALQIATCTGCLTLADDSGLLVDALGGEPGVYSARWRGCQTDAERVTAMLQAMDCFPDPAQRSAHFVCVATLADPGGVLVQLRGECHGRIALQPQGDQGFGYDPVFIPQGRQQTFAQLSADEKAALSHRGSAMRQVIAYLRTVQP